MSLDKVEVPFLINSKAKIQLNKRLFCHLESESELALLARYVYTYQEIVLVTEAPQCNRKTATGQHTDDKRITYKYTNRQCTKGKHNIYNLDSYVYSIYIYIYIYIYTKFYTIFFRAFSSTIGATSSLLAFVKVIFYCKYTTNAVAGTSFLMNHQLCF